MAVAVAAVQQVLHLLLLLSVTVCYCPLLSLAVGVAAVQQVLHLLLAGEVRQAHLP